MNKIHSLSEKFMRDYWKLYNWNYRLLRITHLKGQSNIYTIRSNSFYDTWMSTVITDHAQPDIVNRNRSTNSRKICLNISKFGVHLDADIKLVNDSILLDRSSNNIETKAFRSWFGQMFQHGQRWNWFTFLHIFFMKSAHV